LGWSETRKVALKKSLCQDHIRKLVENSLEKTGYHASLSITPFRTCFAAKKLTNGTWFRRGRRTAPYIKTFN
jgi:hypothetical protein